MIALSKALVPGILLTWIVCSLIAAGGSTGGMLHIFHREIADYTVYFSWTLFIPATGLGWFIFSMLE